MARYLLVLARPASLPALIVRAQLAAEHPRTTFVLITPLPRGGDRDVAEHLATATDVFAVSQLRRARLVVERSEIGDRSPLAAIEDELRAHPDAYDAVILASPRPGRLARLAGLDDHWRARSLPIPVVHVFEDGLADLPPPLTTRARRLGSGPARVIRWVGQMLERPRLGIVLMVVPIVTYLAIGGVLAVFVDRRFLINEILALGFYSALVTGVILLERSPRAPDPPVEETQQGRRVEQ